MDLVFVSCKKREDSDCRKRERGGSDQGDNKPIPRGSCGPVTRNLLLEAAGHSLGEERREKNPCRGPEKLEARNFFHTLFVEFLDGSDSALTASEFA